MNIKLLELANLEVDAKVGRDRHFIAANRKEFKKNFFGLISVIGTALIASNAFTELLSDSHYKTLYVSVISLLVGLSTATLGFLGLEKQIVHHRMVGNLYVEVARKTRHLINKVAANSDEKTIEDEFKKLLIDYFNVNHESESCPTSKSDLDKSIGLNRSKRDSIKSQINKSDDEILGIVEQSLHYSLCHLIANNIKKKVAALFRKIGLLSQKDYELYIKQFS
jgi:hypothetical protein